MHGHTIRSFETACCLKSPQFIKGTYYKTIATYSVKGSHWNQLQEHACSLEYFMYVAKYTCISNS